MLFYIFIIASVLLLTGLLFGRENNGKGFFYASLLLTFIASVRFDVGWDYQTYYHAVDEFFLPTLSRFEPLCLSIALLSVWAGNPYIFFIITSCIIYPLAFYSFKHYSISPVISLIVYVGLFYLSSYSIVRQAIAISICLYAYKYIQRRIFAKYVFCILIASLFHYSAIIALVIYPIYYRIKFKFVIIGLLIVLIFKNALLGILSNYGIYSNYIAQLNDFKGGGMTRYFYMIIFISFFLIIKRRGYSIEEQRLLSIVSVGLFTPYLLGSTMGERVGFYFLIYYCYLIPLLLQNKQAYKKSIYALIFSGYFITMIYFTANIAGQKSPFTPYKTIFGISKVEFKN